MLPYSSMNILIKNGHVIDPKNNLDALADVLIKDGKISAVGVDLNAPANTDIIDAQGKIVTPGFFDIQVHFREPGLVHKESIETGCQAALAGGVTTVVTMPNTQPTSDNPETIQAQYDAAASADLISVFPTACITMNMAGETLSNQKELLEAGAIGFTDDGRDVQSAKLLRDAMFAAKENGALIMSHCEEESLHDQGVMHQGEVSEKLGVAGIPHEVEDFGTFRSVRLAMATGCRLHVLHVSTAVSAEIVRMAKRLGFTNITAEVCPHHLLLDHHEVGDKNPNAKMYPPLRTTADAQALIAAVADGTIDCISTDHAPHAADEKASGFLQAPPGTVGLETMFAATWTAVKDTITLPELIKKMTINPAQVIQKDDKRGHLTPGTRGDVTILDPNQVWTVSDEDLKGKSHNSVFLGKELVGRVTHTICDGKLKYEL